MEITCVACNKSWLSRYAGWFCNPCSYEQKKFAQKASAENAKRVRRGEIPKADTLTCTDCGNPAGVYDHRDYSKPTEVEPVCRACNMKRGPALSPIVRQVFAQNTAGA